MHVISATNVPCQPDGRSCGLFSLAFVTAAATQRPFSRLQSTMGLASYLRVFVLMQVLLAHHQQ